MNIKAIIGLGNPGFKFHYNRHNIGFRIADALAESLYANYRQVSNMELAEAQINNQPLYIIKPQTFMNSSGKVIPFLQKKGIKPENIMVIHDELELPFEKIKIQLGGSHKGHNGLKSLIEFLGTRDFWRCRFGIGRPKQQEDVPNYVLQNFRDPEEVEKKIDEAKDLIIKEIKQT